MNSKLRTVLTALFVVVLMAIYVVGIFLLWDVFNVEGSLDALINKDLYAVEYNTSSDTAVTCDFTGKTLTAGEEQLVREFFTFWYAGLGEKKAERISHFYMVQANVELFDELALDYEVFLAGQCPLDLSFDECSLTLNVRRRHAVPKTAKIEVDVELSSEIIYSATGRTSRINREKHSFVLQTEGKKTLIVDHTTERLSRVYADFGLDRVLADSKLVRSDLNYTFFPKYTAQALELLKGEMTGLSLPASDTSAYPKAEYDYDRGTAANIAIKGFSSAGAFGEYEENDANFISRCIFESGIPMDSQGEKWDQWKWYDDEINTERRKTGCSKSWFDRAAFCRYIYENEGFGLVGCAVATGSGELGDVIQLMHDGEPTQEFMVTGVMASQDGTVRDYLVSNDCYSSVSLLSLGCTEFRVLHIVGYNTANI